MRRGGSFRDLPKGIVPEGAHPSLSSHPAKIGQGGPLYDAFPERIGHRKELEHTGPPPIPVWTIRAALVPSASATIAESADEPLCHDPGESPGQ